MDINRRNFLKISGTGATAIVAGSALKNSAFSEVSLQQSTSNISFAGSSASGTRKQMILDVLEPWRKMVTERIQNRTILIKPNVVANNRALVATHVDALRGLIEFLRSITSQPIIIGESAAGSGVTTGFKNFGYNNLTTEYKDVSLLDLDANNSPITKVERRIWKPDLTSTNTISVFSAFVDPKYFVISITRPKTHNCQVITGICKNILMGAPQMSSKQLMHGQRGWWNGKNTGEDKTLSYNMFQLGNVIFPTGAVALSVLDAWEGMEGNGPGDGTSIMQYCAVAGTDPLAIDRICVKLMGLSDSPSEPMHKATPSYTDARALWWLSEAGIGNYDLKKINFITGSLDMVNSYVKPYKMADTYTGDPSYQTNWTGGPPNSVLDIPKVAVKDSHYLDPKPFLSPQIQSIQGHSQVSISLSLPVSFSISLNILNLQGVKIRTLGDEFLPAGQYSVLWNCKDDKGAGVPSGRYILQLAFDGRSVSDLLTVH